MSTEYHESPIHVWFELSRASWLTLPRVLLEAMPYEWQVKMAGLLREYEEAFPCVDERIDGTRVHCHKNRRLVKTPPEVINYRRPDAAWIDERRGRR